MTARRTIGCAVIGALLALGIVALWLWLWRERVYYKNQIARLERRLDEHRSIPRIQAWLADPRSQRVLRKGRESVPPEWPECIRELRPHAIDEVEGGGVSIMWYHEDLVGVDVFPGGTRPHLPSQNDYYGYRATYGADAYVWIKFK
jgi:hypothetical protein